MPFATACQLFVVFEICPNLQARAREWKPVVGKIPCSQGASENGALEATKIDEFERLL